MKLWKKLMVFGVALLLISAIMAAQYISVSTDATLTVDTQTADLQIAASDPSLSEEGQQYLLEYDGTGFELDLGTWGEQNQFTSSQAFLLVNAGESEIEFTGVEIGGARDASTDIGGSIDIYLSWEEDRDGTTNSVHIWDSDSGETETAYYLNYIEGGIYDTGEGEMTIWHTGDASEAGNLGTAEYLDYGDGSDHWVYDDTTTTGEMGESDPFDAGDTAGPNTNAVWVHIDVNPDAEFTDVTETIVFDVQ